MYSVLDRARRQGGNFSMKNDKKKDRESRSVKKVLEFYKLVVDSVPSGVITVDRQLRITDFNPWAEQLTGYSANEAKGQFCGEVLKGGMCKTRCLWRSLKRCSPS